MSKIAWLPLAGVAALVAASMVAATTFGGGARAQVQEGPDGAQAYVGSAADLARGAPRSPASAAPTPQV